MVGRNDPCPCGSGKKYKKCCLPQDEAGARNRSQTEETYTNLLRGLSRLPGGLGLAEMTYARTHFFGEDLSLLDLPQAEYLSFLDWLLFGYQTPPAGESMADLLVEQMPVGPQKEMLDAWRKTVPSLYRIDLVAGNHMTVADALTGERLVIDMSGAAVEEPGAILAGRFLAVGTTYRPSFDLHRGPDLELIRPLLEAELERLRRAKPEATMTDFLRLRWPLVRELEGALSVSEDDGKVVHVPTITGPVSGGRTELAADAPASWQAVHEKLAASASGWTWDARQRLLRLWVDAAEAMQPKVAKAEPWAAAIAYLYRAKVTGESITQTEIAEQFETSASTVGTKAREITTALSLEAWDDRYADVLAPDWRTQWGAKLFA
ncbi:MAG TPA: SEC-C metal-binding domain-containing protein [Symbiobacteriaceae bacterium]|nr:SEC-C metal-binding domain-containing protein [Symbiobacteriaceae bacterium]